MPNAITLDEIEARWKDTAFEDQEGGYVDECDMEFLIAKARQAIELGGEEIMLYKQ